MVGSRTETGEPPTNALGYKETSISIGTLTYRGKGQPTITGVSEDWLTRSGVKADIWLKDLNVYGAAVFGQDELRGVSPRTINTSAVMAEADYLVLPWVMPTFRFEKTNFSDGRRNIVQMIPALNFMIRANVRVFAEGHFFNRTQAGSRDRTGLNEGLIRLEFLF